MWKQQYAAKRRKKYQTDQQERERRKSQGRTKKENKEYMRAYYQANKHRWKRTRAQQEKINARNREKYASDETYRNKCKAEVRLYQRKNPHVKHRSLLATKYKMTPEDYKKMFDKQGGVCAVCKRENATKIRKYRLFVDHCHNSNIVRGLLCNNCNFAIGHLQDSPELCDSAAAYLRASNNETKVA